MRPRRASIPDEQEISDRCALVRAGWDLDTEQSRLGFQKIRPERPPRVIELDPLTRRILDDEARLVEDFH